MAHGRTQAWSPTQRTGSPQRGSASHSCRIQCPQPASEIDRPSGRRPSEPANRHLPAGLPVSRQTDGWPTARATLTPCRTCCPAHADVTSPTPGEALAAAADNNGSGNEPPTLAQGHGAATETPTRAKGTHRVRWRPPPRGVCTRKIVSSAGVVTGGRTARLHPAAQQHGCRQKACAPRHGPDVITTCQSLPYAAWYRCRLQSDNEPGGGMDMVSCLPHRNNHAAFESYPNP